MLTHFLDRLRNGGFVIDTDHLNIEAQSPVTDIEDLLWCFERNCLCSVYDDEDPVATLDGALVTFALIAQPVWNALVAVAPSQGSVSEWFQGLFGDSSVAGQIYRERLDDVSEHLRELFALSDFLATHGLTWAPPMEPSQRYPSFDYGMQHGSADMREFLVEAKRDYSDTVLRAAIELYEVEVDDMLRGEYDVVVGQSDGADAYRSGPQLDLMTLPIAQPAIVEIKRAIAIHVEEATRIRPESTGRADDDNVRP